MPDMSSINPFYRHWSTMNGQITDAVRGLDDEALALRAGPDHFPIWGLVAHCAGARVFWFCEILGEPGAGTTPFADLSRGGWEDDPDHPRSAAELIGALDSTWAIVQAALDRWTPETLDVEFPRAIPNGTRFYTRQSVIVRLIAHDAYHAGEISQLLGLHGREAIDLWPPTRWGRTVEG